MQGNSGIVGSCSLPRCEMATTAHRIPILAVLRAGHLHFDDADN